MDFLAFVIAFLPCSFEGLEMSFFSYIAKGREGFIGTIAGVLAVIALIYFTYLFLPVLVSDTVEYLIKIILGMLLLAMGTLFIFIDYPINGKSSFLIAFLGIIGEGIEVDIFTVSSWLMTGDFILAMLGGILGFLWILTFSKVVYIRIKESTMRHIATVILYIVGFIVLTSGIV